MCAIVFQNIRNNISLFYFLDEIDLFEEVKLKKPQYNELLENFLMDQNRKLSKTILEDGEFSDEVKHLKYSL